MFKLGRSPMFMFYFPLLWAPLFYDCFFPPHCFPAGAQAGRRLGAGPLTHLASAHRRLRAVNARLPEQRKLQQARGERAPRRARAARRPPSVSGAPWMFWGTMARSAHASAAQRALERNAARICREAGARVAENMLLRDLNLDVRVLDDHRLEVVANALPILGRRAGRG